VGEPEGPPLRGSGASDFWRFDNAHAAAGRRVLNRPDQRGNHVAQCHQPQAQRRFTFRRDQPRHRIERQQKVWPSMTGAEHVPRPQDGCGQTCVGNRALARRSRLDVRVHDGRRLRNADIYEMHRACAPRGVDRGEDRWHIDALKLRRFRRRRMRRANQMDDGIGGCQGRRERRRVEGIAHDGRRAGGDSAH
jgi:hypothetical protein